jgi:sugar O-acyltransferase (sialic acid O-acetyltransferase NeuD family)
MKKNFVIIGAGGFAREVLDIFEAAKEAGQNCEVLGYLVEAQYGLQGKLINDRPILGDFGWLAERAKKVLVICGVGDPMVRKRLIERARDGGARFGNIIHPSAILTKHITLGEGIVIAAGCILTNNIRIGDHVHVNLDCTIGHDCVLENYTTLAPGVHVSGCVTLGEGCHIGTGANIVEKKMVGAWSQIGAGSVVIADIPQHSTAVGVPAKVIKTRAKR